MHVELTDLFRCPVPHRESWLVVAAHRTESRVILDGVLGCPECGAEYGIRDGIALFGERPMRSVADGRGADADEDGALRMAALLGATDAGATLALIGAPGTLARAIQSIVPVRCLVVDPLDEDSALAVLRAHEAPLAFIRSNGTLPVANGVLHGVYVEIGAPAAYTAALRTGGRLVAPVARDVPAGIRELARDTAHWVGEKTAGMATGRLVELKRR
jgi:uncharacterized protein YbaR (Trm112 family)